MKEREHGSLRKTMDKKNKRQKTKGEERWTETGRLKNDSNKKTG